MTRCDEILDAAAAGAEPRRLNEQEVYRLLDAAGVRRGRTEFLPEDADAHAAARWARAAAELADAEGRLVLKVVGRSILHKTEAGGVRVLRLAGSDPADRRQAVAEAAEAIRKTASRAVPKAAIEGVLAAEFVPHGSNVPGQELLLSVRQDPAFGPVVVVGVGGTLT